MYDPYYVRPIRKKKDNTVKIFGWCYPIILIFGYLVGWAIGGSIG